MSKQQQKKAPTTHVVEVTFTIKHGRGAAKVTHSVKLPVEVDFHTVWASSEDISRRLTWKLQDITDRIMSGEAVKMTVAKDQKQALVAAFKAYLKENK